MDGFCRLMSDYEVTLIHDSSKPCSSIYHRVLIPCSVCCHGPSNTYYAYCPAGRSSSFASTVQMRVGSDRHQYTLVADCYVAPFAGGVWKVHVELPDQYPYKSPSIGFVNRIFHPNIDETYAVPWNPSSKLTSHRSGSVCLDVINQTWSPMYDMINIFEVFLPQLLRYPNPTDPLNGEAAALLMREPKSYEAKVKGIVSRSPGEAG